jgi:hypothetical protein
MTAAWCLRPSNRRKSGRFAAMTTSGGLTLHEPLRAAPARVGRGGEVTYGPAFASSTGWGHAKRASPGPGSAHRCGDVRALRLRDRDSGDAVRSPTFAAVGVEAAGLRRAGRDSQTLGRGEASHRRAPLPARARDAHLLVPGPARARHLAEPMGRSPPEEGRARQSRGQPGTAAAALALLRRRHLVLLRPQVRRAADDVVEPLPSAVPTRLPRDLAVPASP